jgi:hypothetical protein
MDGWSWVGRLGLELHWKRERQKERRSLAAGSGALYSRAVQ